MAAPPPVGWVRVTTTDPPLRVVARLGDERPNVESGYGGWEEIERPRRAPLTTWKSSPGLHLTLPLLLDGFVENLSVEPQIARLERMARPGGANGEPPHIKISSQGSAVPYQDRTWVISDIAWGDALMNKGGNRVRQALTLTLLQFVEDVYLADRSAANRRRRKAQQTKKRHGAASKRIVVKKKASVTRTTAKTITTPFGEGEDLLTIAAREYGDADRWVEIAEANGLRDPRATTPGQVLRLP